MPRAWTPLSKPIFLEEDHETVYRDINAAMSSAHSFDATAAAVMTLAAASKSPDPDNHLDLSKIDLIACASTIGNLLRFARQKAKRFRILVYQIENKVHLIRREDTPKEIIEGIHGFGHTFPEAYTTWDASVNGSVSNQRICTYKFGNLNCLVRFEVDGYFPDKADRQVCDSDSKKEKGPSVDTLDELFRKATLDDTDTPDVIDQLFSETTVENNAAVDSSSSLSVTRGGQMMKGNAIFDLKTRSIKLKPNTEFIIEEEMPRFWVRQTENLVLAFHTLGKFYDVQIHDVRDDVKAWELENAESLARLSSLLSIIIAMVAKLEEKQLEIVCENEGTSLQIHEVHGDVPFPMSDKTKAAWAAKLRG